MVAQHRGEARFPVLVSLLKQVPTLWKLWPALPVPTPFLGAMLQDCLTWAQKRLCVDRFCEQNSIAFLATVHSGIPIPRQSGGTLRCESEEDAHVSCPQVPASRCLVPETPLQAARQRPREARPLLQHVFGGPWGPCRNVPTSSSAPRQPWLWPLARAAGFGCLGPV